MPAALAKWSRSRSKKEKTNQAARLAIGGAGEEGLLVQRAGIRSRVCFVFSTRSSQSKAAQIA